jgi:hypothetical protein
MSKNPESRSSVCGNCKYFVAGGLCQLVKGEIKTKDTCDLHEYGNPQPIDTKINPTYNKLEVNYRLGSLSETLSGDLVQKAIQMEHELLSRGVPEEEVHRAVVEYFSQREPPYAMQWPGPVTGYDLAGRLDPLIVPDTGVPLTDFTGLPKNVEPFPTSNKSPYGIGDSYPSNPTPDPNSLGNLSNTYDVLNPPYPGDNTNWSATASKKDSEPLMRGEHGFTVEKAIPEWRYPVEQSQTYPLKVPDIVIPPSGINPLAEAYDSDELRAGIEIELEHTDNRNTAKQIAIDHLNEDPKYYTKLLTHVEPKKKYLLEKISEAKKPQDLKKLLAKWALLLGGAVGINALLKNYEDSGVDGEPPTDPLEIFAEYQYHGHDSDDECAPYNGKRFNLLETHNRPVIPSENLGYTTTHPNCKCTWKVIQNYKKAPDSLTRKEESEIHGIESHIKKAANDGTLHTVKKDGKLSDRTRTTNPMKELCSCMNVSIPEIKLDIPSRSLLMKRKNLQETMSELRSEFGWLTDDYILKAKELSEEANGRLYLIRAAGETVTDHRGEGEPYKRKLSSDELNSMTRTAIGKKMDINHQPEYETDATILDAEFDKNRKEIQMLVLERDPQINNAIEDGKITAVSINGGMPRNESIEPCNHNCKTNNCELCLVPKGVVLGEIDGIGMTWVVTDPDGLYWNGHYLPKAQPGIKFTKIEAL